MVPLDDLPRFPLLDGPSPVQPLPRFGRALGAGAEIWIKREDLLPLAFGGNKLRNLEFLVGAALAEGADTLLTAGRRWSNHCRLTAAAGARAGMDVHLVLSGPPRPDGPNVSLERLLGATVHVAASAERVDREALVADVTRRLAAAGRRVYQIEVGGSGVIGAAGQVLAGVELIDQLRARAAEPDVVVIPSATGGTQAGVIRGLRERGSRARVIGVVVARPPHELRPRIEAILAGLQGVAGGALPTRESIELDDTQLGAGYGRPTAAADEATALLARTEGILVDPIYTAKALAALVERARRRQLDGRRVVFWHAGGTPGLFEPLEG